MMKFTMNLLTSICLALIISRNWALACPKSCQCFRIARNNERAKCQWTSIKGQSSFSEFTSPKDISALEISCLNLAEPSNFFNGMLSPFSNLKHLTLSNCVPGLGTLPQGLLQGLSQLHSLTLRGNLGINRIEIEPGFLGGSQNLETVEITNFGIAKMPPKELCSLNELKLLNLSHNVLTSLADTGVKDCPGQLVMLDLSENKMSDLDPDSFARFKTLMHLILDGNRITQIQESVFAGLKNLRKLHIARNQISGFAENFTTALPNLQFLDLAENAIARPSADLLTSNSLLSLNLSGNSIDEFDSSLKIQMPQLTILDLSANKLALTPSNFFDNLTSLQKLDLSSNLLTELPSYAFSDLPNLVQLNLDFNQLESLKHDSFYHLEKLSDLTLKNNSLRSLPDDFFAGMPRISRLDLSDNYLEHAPGAMTVLYYLAELNLANNRISIGHKFLFDRLTNLRVLNLAQNILTEVDRYVFENVPKLEILDLSSNVIRSFRPNCLHKSNNLQKLFLQDNAIESIQGTLPNLPKLALVNVTNNKIGHIDHSMLPTSLSVLLASRNKVEKFTNFLDRQILLEILDLSNNNLSILTESSLSDSLVMANFSRNQIASLEENSLLGKANLTHFDLSWNNLEEISEKSIFSVQDRIVGPELYLEGNPLKCSCKTDWLLKDWKAANLPNVHNFEVLRCKNVLEPGSSPVLVSQVPKAQFLCPYQEVCYDHCVCCKFDACDCRSTCPKGCTCYQDSSFAENIVRCSNLASPDFSLTQIPMHATEIRLDGTNFGSKMQKHSFLGRYRLKALYLNGSGIGLIEPRTFVGLTALKVLDLSGNNLTEITGGEFVNIPRLTSLNLAQNQIKWIEKSTFDEMPHLANLNLQSNQLKFLPEAVSSLSMVKPDLRLSISENPWKCDCFDRFDLQMWLPRKFAQVIDYRSVYCFENLTENEELGGNGSTVLATLPSVANENTIKVNFWTFRKDFNASSLCEGRPIPSKSVTPGKFDPPPTTTPNSTGVQEVSESQERDFAGEILLEDTNFVIWALVGGLIAFVTLLMLLFIIIWRYRAKIAGEKLNSSHTNYSACSGSSKRNILTPMHQVQLSDMDISPNSSGGASSPYRGGSSVPLMQNDAFVFYSLADADYVHNHIARPLEDEGPYYQLQLLHRDLRNPTNFHMIDDSIICAVERCKRVILVLSEAFLAHEWQLLHIKTTIETVIEKTPQKLISIILTESLSVDNGLAKHLRRANCLYATDPMLYVKLRDCLPDKIVYSSLNTTLRSSNGLTTYDSCSQIVPSQFV